MTCAIVLYALFGGLSGYLSARLYKSFLGRDWIKIAKLTSMLSPGIVVGLFLVMNSILWSEESSGVVPIETLFMILSLWLLFSVPLTFLGACFGFYQQPIKHPEPVNEIPSQPRTVRRAVGTIFAGILPFGELDLMTLCLRLSKAS